MGWVDSTVVDGWKRGKEQTEGKRELHMGGGGEEMNPAGGPKKTERKQGVGGTGERSPSHEPYGPRER